MPRIDANTKNGLIEINSYNGDLMQKEVSQIEDYWQTYLPSKTWDFF